MRGRGGDAGTDIGAVLDGVGLEMKGELEGSKIVNLGERGPRIYTVAAELWRGGGGRHGSTVILRRGSVIEKRRVTIKC
ncbi:hypothetical protein L195_g015884 [Trifolium pratense]|uniref:Uncharacterized protein n=1 Tax=Trifolium pratense TaxID=57577 RepID=A0A2K3MPK1_TRIPR|nr:hypothetical protein L195_g015884 [Trifolium pratense]